MPKMGRPPKATSDAVLTKRANIMFSPDLWAWMERQAAINKQTVSAYIREVMENERREDEQ